MLQYVDCVYRIAERAEMLYGRFDILSGTICGDEHLLMIDVVGEYDYTMENYTYHNAVPTTQLFNMLCMFPNALAAINYNNIGAVVVFREKHSLYLFEPRSFVKHTAFLDKQFDIKTEVIGIVRTQLKTFEKLHPLSLLVADITSGNPVVYTMFGKKNVKAKYDKPEGLNLSRYLEMVHLDDVYGSIERKGKVLFLGINCDDLIEIKGGAKK